MRRMTSLKPSSRAHDAMGTRRRHARRRGALNDEDVNFIEEIWGKYDTNDDGEMQESEVVQLMTEINEGAPPSLKEVRLLIRAADADGSGTISKGEVRKLVETWFVVAEDKRRGGLGARLASATKGLLQAASLNACMHEDNTQGTIVTSPGDQAVQYWEHARATMEDNYKKSEMGL